MRDTGQTDFLRSRPDAIIDMGHLLVKLAQTIDWSFLEQRFGAVYEDKPAAAVDAADGGACDPQAHRRPL